MLKNKVNGGETGIRTQDGVAPMPVFKTGAFNRSAISPLASFYSMECTISTIKHVKNSINDL